jgi:hypothetical protein
MYSVDKAANVNQKNKLKRIMKEKHYETFEYDILKKVVDKFVNHSKVEKKKFDFEREKHDFVL